MTSSHTQPDEAELLPIGEAARALGVSVDTLRRWERAGQLVSVRTVGGHRRYLRRDLEVLSTGGAA